MNIYHLQPKRELIEISHEEILEAVTAAAHAVGVAEFAYSFTAAAEEAATDRLAA